MQTKPGLKVPLQLAMPRGAQPGQAQHRGTEAGMEDEDSPRCCKMGGSRGCGEA